MLIDRLPNIMQKPDNAWQREIELTFVRWSQTIADFSRVAFQYDVSEKTASCTLNKRQSVVVCDATAGAFSVTLPPTKEMTNRAIYIKKTDASANAVTVDGNSTEKIDGAETVSLPNQYDCILIVSSGTEWHKLSTV